MAPQCELAIRYPWAGHIDGPSTMHHGKTYQMGVSENKVCFYGYKTHVLSIVVYNVCNYAFCFY